MRISNQGVKVLLTMLSDLRREWSGSEIGATTKVLSGTLYPLLLRFETSGLVISRWEDICPREAGRPRRRLYKLSGEGVAKAQEIASELRQLGAMGGVPA